MVNLTRIILIIILFNCVKLSFSASVSARTGHRQRGAKVDYFNPKYVSDAVAFTVRARRNRPYLTNVTLTYLVSLNNNATIRIQHNMKHSPIDFELVLKACEIKKIKWFHDFILSFSDIDTNKCPFPARTYHFYNVMFEADKIMIPMPQGTNELTAIMEVTNTRELMIKMSITLDV